MKSGLASTARGVLSALAMALLATAAVPSQAGVRTDGFFELDGNTLDPNGVAAPDDWNSFFNGQGTTPRATGITLDTEPAVFRNGSKDTQDISAWRFDLGSSPPKNDMLAAYAAAYTAANGNLLIYFGADRDSFTGTASLGFWFFKNPVARNNANGTFINPVTGQPATHANGDTLVAFEYTNGGAVTSVRVFKWQNGALVESAPINTGPTVTPGVFCDPNDTVCGSTNSGNITLAWNGTVEAGRFFEGGINVSAIVGGDACFSTFMATSRSSSEPNASIKNFIIDNFPVCSIDLTKACTGAQFNGATNTVTNFIKGRILNDGGGVLSNIVLSDSPQAFENLQYWVCDANGDPTGTSKALSTLGPNESICYTATTTSNTLSTTDTATVTASTGAGSVTDSASANCVAPPPALAVAVSKTCDVDLEIVSAKLAVKVEYSGTVTNNSGVTLSGVQVCEVPSESVLAGDEMKDPCDLAYSIKHVIGTLAPGAGAQYSGSYYPATLPPATLESPDSATFSDKVGAFGLKPEILRTSPQDDLKVKAVPTSASCPLCQ